MLYSEFVEGTGCRQNDHNYQVYKNLEIMYMNSDMSKQEIYEYGKKLVDNSKTEDELVLEAKTKEAIRDYKLQIEQLKRDRDRYREYYQDMTNDKAVRRFWRHRAGDCTHDIKRARLQIQLLKKML